MATSSGAAPFLGLPPELRLYVYELVLAPYHSEFELFLLDHDNPNAHHSCFQEESDYASSLTCKCAGHMHTQILRTNKLIFYEAMPVLYKNMQLAVVKDVLAEKNALDRTLSRLPEYAYHNITKVSIIGRFSDFVYRKLDKSKSERARTLRHYCKTLAAIFPNLSHVHIVIEVHGRLEITRCGIEYMSGSEFDYASCAEKHTDHYKATVDTFSFLTAITSLKSVSIYSGSAYGGWCPKYHVTAAIREAAEHQGRQLSVCEVGPKDTIVMMNNWN